MAGYRLGCTVIYCGTVSLLFLTVMARNVLSGYDVKLGCGDIETRGCVTRLLKPRARVPLTAG